MNKDKANILLDKLENNDVIQNLIAQGDSRYILYNVKEPIQNFPNYSIGLDEKLTSIALSYLSIGCFYAENGDFQKANGLLEKGATILENVHSPSGNRSDYSSYFILTSSLGFYSAHQYSKSFILLKNVELDTVIAKLIGSLLKRDYYYLGDMIKKILLSNDYADSILANIEDHDVANTRIYTLILARVLSCLLEFIFSGNDEWLNKSKEFINDLLEILSIDGEPSMWWSIRLLRIIIDGFYENSLWKTIPPVMDDGQNGDEKVVDDVIKDYILAMTFQKSPIVELFHSQRVALPKVLNPLGAVISLPTSAGKTRIAEIGILQILLNDPEAVTLYLAPFRSLAYEVEDSLSKTFRPLGFEVSHLYGGMQFSKLDEMVINESNIIIATPEKAKAILRSNSEVKAKIKLVIIDEGHLLGANKRYLTTEAFIEELRFFIKKNKGKMILLSAVLPNADEIARWITGDDQMYVESKWRPSTQRCGLLEYTGKNVNITWKGELESYNYSFIQPFKRPRSKYPFPNDKKQAIAATALKLSADGSVLIFVARQRMVVSQAREILKAMGQKLEEHHWSCKQEWNAFKLASSEAYGSDSEIFMLANQGIICHHAGLTTEVRLSIERLLRKGNPKIVVATSTLGQGVNIGVSTVIFANVWIDHERRINSNDFWNIAGRAGRSFVDREGKILFAVDASQGSYKTNRNRTLAMEYLDSGNQKSAMSGLLALIRYIYKVAKKCGIDFDILLQLIAENDLSQFREPYASEVPELFDLIDDTLLSLNQEFKSYQDEDQSSWIDDYFRQSLAYIQSKHADTIESEDVISFLKARNRGVIKMAGDPMNWHGYVSSSIPLRSGLFIKQEIPYILEVVTRYQSSDQTIEDLIEFLKETEKIISRFPSGQFSEVSNLSDEDIMRRLWMQGESLISLEEKALDKCNQYFGFTIPWALNAIARSLSSLNMEEEAKLFEELAVLVQMGLPSMFAAHIYFAGIQSRVAATELSFALDPRFQELSIKILRQEIIKNADSISEISTITRQWVLLLKELESNGIYYAEKIPDFRLKGDISVNSRTLSVKKFGDDYYLCSPDFKDKIKIGVTKQFPFDNFTDDFGVFFEKNNAGHWVMKIRNPYLMPNQPVWD